MRFLLLAAFLLTTLVRAAQVTLREGETGRLGGLVMTVLRVEDHRCGPTENCISDVVAEVRLQDGSTTRMAVVSLDPLPPQPWSGLGVVRMTPDHVTLTDQPEGRPAGQQDTLKRGETRNVGRQQVTVQGWESVHCAETVLCVRPTWSYVYLKVSRGSRISSLTLEYPRVMPWPGVTLTGATLGPRPQLTFSDQRP
ncbi:hypothetical protein [Deinococcus sonorensis]|uniref:Lipoprotein n=2 Tax=Deinococcus sonorensis TaxID=309891 RepID=A0AAU7UGF9_9DEIO